MPKKKIVLPAWHKQKHLAEALELDTAYLSRILSGKEYLTEENALRMSAYFEVLQSDVNNIREVLRESEPKPKLGEKASVVKWWSTFNDLKKKIEKRFEILQQKL